MPLSSPRVSPLLVEREDELAALDHLLAEAGGLAENELLAAVRSLVGRRVLVADANDERAALALRHGLTSDALRDRLLLEDAYRRAGFGQIETRVVPSPLLLPTAAGCVRFERESFGALHQMLAGLPEAERAATWEAIETELRQFEGPCEMIDGVGVT